MSEQFEPKFVQRVHVSDDSDGPAFVVFGDRDGLIAVVDVVDAEAGEPEWCQRLPHVDPQEVTQDQFANYLAQAEAVERREQEG